MNERREVRSRLQAGHKTLRHTAMKLANIVSAFSKYKDNSGVDTRAADRILEMDNLTDRADIQPKQRRLTRSKAPNIDIVSMLKILKGRRQSKRDVRLQSLQVDHKLSPSLSRSLPQHKRLQWFPHLWQAIVITDCVEDRISVCHTMKQCGIRRLRYISASSGEFVALHTSNTGGLVSHARCSDPDHAKLLANLVSLSSSFSGRYIVFISDLDSSVMGVLQSIKTFSKLEHLPIVFIADEECLSSNISNIIQSGADCVVYRPMLSGTRHQEDDDQLRHQAHDAYENIFETDPLLSLFWTRFFSPTPHQIKTFSQTVSMREMDEIDDGNLSTTASMAQRAAKAWKTMGWSIEEQAKMLKHYSKPNRVAKLEEAVQICEGIAARTKPFESYATQQEYMKHRQEKQELLRVLETHMRS